MIRIGHIGPARDGDLRGFDCGFDPLFRRKTIPALNGFVPWDIDDWLHSGGDFWDFATDALRMTHALVFWEGKEALSGTMEIIRDNGSDLGAWSAAGLSTIRTPMMVPVLLFSRSSDAVLWRLAHAH